MGERSRDDDPVPASLRNVSISTGSFKFSFFSDYGAEPEAQPFISKKYFRVSSPPIFVPYIIGSLPDKHEFIHYFHCTLQMISPFSPVFPNIEETHSSSLSR